ncbi:hypothetical protein BB560_000291 [Smittium megazygosporum]|uniref:BTB domain-containing protein n=1 Tax=Smittium megazygosporum TaxID=133381 RepID=A0A2T9ZKX4_9FUNG|nr:hypothetical protein BB560_000291 [Smittium megazygosporum]
MELEKYISEIKKQKKAFSSKNEYNLEYKISNCNGNIPPPLVGATTAFLDGRVYLHGGRIEGSGSLNSDIYVFHPLTKKWRIVDGYSENQLQYNDRQKLINLKALDYESIKNTRLKRAFHSAVIFKRFIVFFGGITADPHASEKSSPFRHNRNSSRVFGVRNKNFPIFRNILGSQTNQASETLSTHILGDGEHIVSSDVIAFDTKYEVWIEVASIGKSIRSLNKLEMEKAKNVNPAGNKFVHIEVMDPQPRYAHLASVVYGDKMVIIGGKGNYEEQIKEFNVYDLTSHRWICKKIVDADISVFISSLRPLFNGSALLYTSRSVGNKNYGLYSIGPAPKFLLEQVSHKSDLKIPHVKLPELNIISDSSTFLSGLFLDSNKDLLFSIWSYNSVNKSWRSLLHDPDNIKGSWGCSNIIDTTQKLISFGDSNIVLKKRAKNDQNVFNQCIEIDLRLLGLANINSVRSEVVFSKLQLDESENLDLELSTLSDSILRTNAILESAQNLGFLALSTQQLSDVWLETTDGKIVLVNSRLLEERCIAMCKSWSIGTIAANSERRTTENYSYIYNDSIIQINRPDKSALTKRNSASRLFNLKNSKNINKMLVPEVSDVVIPLIKFIYSGVLEIVPPAAHSTNSTSIKSSILIDSSNRRTISVLGRLIYLGQSWNLDNLVSAASLLLEQKISYDTVLYILDAVHKLKLPHIERICLSVIKNNLSLKNLQESYIWNNLSESTRYYVESKIAEKQKCP